jgi:riboflavin biosynthesis pyrimidine reductase
MAAGLVDELHLFVTPITLGGTPALPGRFHSNLDLLSVDRFDSGVVHLRYGFSS